MFKSFLFFLILYSITAEIPLDQEVYITNTNLPGNYVFTIADASLEDGALLKLDVKKTNQNDHQKFVISYRNGYYVIKAVHSSKLLTIIPNSDKVIQQHDLNNDYYAKNQYFSLLLRNFTPGSVYCIYSFAEAKLLQFAPDFDYVEGHWIKVSDEVKQAFPTYGDPQKWIFELVNNP